MHVGGGPKREASSWYSLSLSRESQPEQLHVLPNCIITAICFRTVAGLERESNQLVSLYKQKLFIIGKKIRATLPL